MASEGIKRSTDGPWHYVPWHIAEGPSEVRHSDGWLICTTPSDDSARLISAAPEMLAALRPFLKEAQRLGLSSLRPDDERLTVTVNAGDIRAALAAIAKAAA